jgi:hypothetical protein
MNRKVKLWTGFNSLIQTLRCKALGVIEKGGRLQKYTSSFLTAGELPADSSLLEQGEEGSFIKNDLAYLDEKWRHRDPLDVENGSGLVRYEKTI